MRGRGGFIGANVTPASAALNSAASGVWTVREAEALKRAGTWPRAFVNPTSITGLQLWLDASDGQTLFDATTGGSLVAADGAVARWEDKSGNGRHATQSTAGSRPTRKTASQNSRDVVRFGGGSTLSLASDLSLGASQSVAVVFKPTTTITQSTSSQSLLSGGSYVEAVTSDFSLSLGSTSGNFTDERLLIFALTVNVFGYAKTDGNISGTNLAFYSFTTTGNVFSGRLNGQASFATASSVGGFSAAGDVHYPTTLRTIGSRNSAAFFSGDICEVCVFNSALASDARNALESYLISKWGIV